MYIGRTVLTPFTSCKLQSRLLWIIYGIHEEVLICLSNRRHATGQIPRQGPLQPVRLEAAYYARSQLFPNIGTWIDILAILSSSWQPWPLCIKHARIYTFSRLVSPDWLESLSPSSSLISSVGFPVIRFSIVFIHNAYHYTAISSYISLEFPMRRGGAYNADARHNALIWCEGHGYLFLVDTQLFGLTIRPVLDFL